MQVHTVETYEEITDVKGIAIANPNLTVEEKVRTYFDDIPIMAEVARCESQFTHIDPRTGLVNRGRVNPKDVGVMQINQYYHETTAQHMGLELTTFEDNLTYARYLYEREGTQPWSASSACWNNSLLAMR